MQSRTQIGEPVRTIPIGRRSVTGRAPVKGRSVGFESSLECDFLELVESDRAVRAVLEQPIRIDYRDADGRKRRYTPDYLVEHVEGPSAIVEVKFRSELRKSWTELRPRLRAGVAHARRHGMRFKIMTDVEIRTSYLVNVRFLRGFRRAAPLVDDATEEHLVGILESVGVTTPSLLLDAAYDYRPNRLSAIPVLWRLIGQGRIGTNLRVPLTMTSEIWVNDGQGTDWPGPHSYLHPLAQAAARRAAAAEVDRAEAAGARL
jgi:hypothetical protein